MSPVSFPPALDRLRRSPVLTGLVLCCASVCLGLMSLYFSAGQYRLQLFSYYLSQPKVLVLNTVPYLLLAFALFFLSGRAWVGFLGSGAVCLVYSWAEYWKLMARNDPVFAEDLTILAEAAQMSGQYVQFTWQNALSLVLVILGTAVFFFFQGRINRLPVRLALCGTVIALSGGLYATTYTDSGVYNSMQVWPEINQWFETNKYISRGGIYPFIHSIQTAVPKAPTGYNGSAAAAVLESYESHDIPEEKKVSVITVMYEAFSDLSAYSDRITGADPFAAFHALQAESYHGTLITNIFAGGTIDTERCVLTGYSTLTNFRRPGWSYARYFADQGYTTNGAHAGNAAFYNRINVNENLGIADYRFIEGYYENLYPNAIPMDYQLLPDIAEYCKKQMAEGPVFSFNVTYQNHGPYYTDYVLFEKEYVPQGDLSLADYNIANNYLWGVEDTGNQMMAMVDSFRDSSEPVVLVFFGDHKPWLGDQSSTYSALGIDIFSQNDESFYTYYATEYIIWANDAAKAVLGSEFTGEGPTVSPCYLMNLVFEQCGWEGPGFMKLSNDVRQALPIIHTTGRMQVDGIMTEEADLSPEDAELLSKFRNAQFYLAQDSGGVHPE